MDLHTFMEEKDGMPLTTEERIQYYEILAKEFEKAGDQESANHYYFIKEMLEKSIDRRDSLPDCLKVR